MLTVQKRIVLLSITVLAAANAALAQDRLGIADIAPPESFLVVGVDDWASFNESFNESPLGAMWSDQRIRSIGEELISEAKENLVDQLAEIDLELSDIQAPAGGAGVAVYFGTNADEELQPNFVALAEYGENADDWADFIARLIERAEDDDAAEISEEEYEGSTITTFKIVQEEDEEIDHTGHDHGDLDSSSPFAELDTLFIARAADTFIAGSELTVVESTIDAVNGEAIDSVSSSEAFQDAMNQHEQEPDVFGVLLTEPLLEYLLPVWGELAQAVGGPPIEDLLDVTGLLEIRAASASYTFGAVDSAIDGSVALLVPVKKGLLELLDGDAGPAEPPAFIGPDVASLSSYYFRISGLLDIVRDLIAKLPEGEREQLEAYIGQVEPMFGPLLQVLGPQVYTYVSFSRPLSAESQLQIFAIEVSDEAAFNNSVSMLGMMLQLEAREFEGNRIFVGPDASFAIGVGFGHAFIGATTGVENAMRQAGRPDAARLATEPRFIDATSAIDQDGIGFAYMDTRQMLEWTYWSAENYIDIQSAWIDELELEDAEKEEWLAEISDDQPEWMKKLPPREAFLEHLGDMFSNYRSTPEGFVVRTILLSPQD